MISGEHRETSDADLVRAIAAGDQAAFAALYDRHCHRSYRLAHAILGERAAAEEVVLTVFLHLWRRAGSHDLANSAVRTWLLTTIRHAAIGHKHGHGVEALDKRAICHR